MGRKSRAKDERRAYRAEKAARLVRAAEDGQRRGCLFCRRRDVPFTSVEHALPEGLGNTEKVLPAGVVCDRCNHGICARLDQALIDFPPLALLRTTKGVPSKRGSPPSVKFDNGSMSSNGSDELYLELDSKKWRTPARPTGDGRVSWSFTSQMSGLGPRKYAAVQRALVKCAMEFAWLDHGELMLGSTFDRERGIVMTGGQAGYLLVPKTCDVVDSRECSFTYDLAQTTRAGERTTLIAAEFWGVVIATDTAQSAPVAADEDVNVLRFDAKDHDRKLRGEMLAA